jgi:hypothetical protein
MEEEVMALLSTHHVPEDHPKAVEERDGDADAVGGGVAEPLPNKEAIVQDVAVGQHSPLGQTCSIAKTAFPSHRPAFQYIDAK